MGENFRIVNAKLNNEIFVRLNFKHVLCMLLTHANPCLSHRTLSNAFLGGRDGHIPRKISSICSLFLRQGGSITCHVTGGRCYLGDLVQGRFEVPGKKLNDLYINLAQTVLKQQFSDLVGLKSTVLHTRKHLVEEKKEKVQIVHSRGDH